MIDRFVWHTLKVNKYGKDVSYKYPMRNSLARHVKTAKFFPEFYVIGNTAEDIYTAYQNLKERVWRFW